MLVAFTEGVESVKHQCVCEKDWSISFLVAMRPCCVFCVGTGFVDWLRDKVEA